MNRLEDLSMLDLMAMFLAMGLCARNPDSWRAQDDEIPALAYDLATQMIEQRLQRKHHRSTNIEGAPV